MYRVVTSRVYKKSEHISMQDRSLSMGDEPSVVSCQCVTVSRGPETAYVRFCYDDDAELAHRILAMSL